MAQNIDPEAMADDSTPFDQPQPLSEAIQQQRDQPISQLPKIDTTTEQSPSEPQQ